MLNFLDPWTGSERDYHYDELLQRVFGIMRDKNPEMVGGDRKKFVMRPPQVRQGDRRMSVISLDEAHHVTSTLASDWIDNNVRCHLSGREGWEQEDGVCKLQRDRQDAAQTAQAPAALPVCWAWHQWRYRRQQSADYQRQVPAETHRERVEEIHQGVCHLPHLQVSRYHQWQCIDQLNCVDCVVMCWPEICISLRSPDTILNKETRLYFLQCMTCHSSCSVQAIKTGFQVNNSFCLCQLLYMMSWSYFRPSQGRERRWWLTETLQVIRDSSAMHYSHSSWLIYLLYCNFIIKYSKLRTTRLIVQIWWNNYNCF